MQENTEVMAAWARLAQYGKSLPGSIAKRKRGEWLAKAAKSFVGRGGDPMMMPRCTLEPYLAETRPNRFRLNAAQIKVAEMGQRIQRRLPINRPCASVAAEPRPNLRRAKIQLVYQKNKPRYPRIAHARKRIAWIKARLADINARRNLSYF